MTNLKFCACLNPVFSTLKTNRFGLSVKNIYVSTNILFAGLHAAGTDTSTDTLKWVVLYLIAYPECQKKMQEEIDSVLGELLYWCIYCITKDNY